MVQSHVGFPIYGLLAIRHYELLLGRRSAWWGEGGAVPVYSICTSFSGRKCVVMISRIEGSSVVSTTLPVGHVDREELCGGDVIPYVVISCVVIWEMESAAEVFITLLSRWTCSLYNLLVHAEYNYATSSLSVAYHSLVFFLEAMTY